MENKYLTITALTKYLKRKIEMDPHLRNIWLKGEISNFKLHSRGHMYMTIKDDHARIQAVMFAGNNRFLKFRPENGMNVLIRGEISVYEAQGQYQLYIQQMEPDGIGSLYLAYEQLKEALQKKGYFDSSYKKPIPTYPKHIGVVTSPTGAAVRDIISTIKRRYPIVKITVLPVLVQGVNAAQSIKRAIDNANRIGGFDTLIIGRGGGSIEELWSFNEEVVATAIFQSKIPIISAVGHETDTTISDYVADLRAPTPTGAAELAVPSRLELHDRINSLTQSLHRELMKELINHQKHLQRLRESYAFRFPKQLIKQKELELDQSLEKMSRAVERTLMNKQKSIDNLNKRFAAQHPKQQIEQARSNVYNLNKLKTTHMTKIIERKTNDIKNVMDKLTLLNPLEIMKRGFALPYQENGEMIKSTKQVQTNDQIMLQLNDGKLSCQVLKVEGDTINE